VGKKTEVKTIRFFLRNCPYGLIFLTALASEPKRSELYKNNPPNKPDASASGPIETDALASEKIRNKI
jgi:hypothetical protein